MNIHNIWRGAHYQYWEITATMLCAGLQPAAGEVGRGLGAGQELSLSGLEARHGAQQTAKTISLPLQVTVSAPRDDD